MPAIPFPNVPDVPGVPLVPRSPLFPPTVQIGLGVIQGALWRAFQTETRWGIFSPDGTPLADPKNLSGITGAILSTIGGFGIAGRGFTAPTMSTGSVDYGKEMKVADFPVERGSFASYNKVETPATPIVTMCFTGSESERTKFLNAIDAATKSTDLYTVVTPEVQYIGYSLERYNYQRRSDRGATLLIVEIALKEIRQVEAQYTAYTPISDPTDPAATPPTDTGKVQGQPPEQSTLLKVIKALGLQ